jgi:uroporphyrin-III C-methyltransferase / precorrin-2 dehydrogenase / sirohydrochlorin ferrochelatase
MQIVSQQPNRDARPRMSALEVLPVFFNLKDKRVLVAGGEEPAAWKAELLAAAGAIVTVHAHEICEEMKALAERGTVSIDHRRWRDGDWAELALAVGDCAEAEAAEFAAFARANSVPVNVIDKPAHCQFQFGAIVNRSPLVIGISTNGAAPILGQAVRRRIETLLPSTLAAWAKLAQDIRGRVLTALAPGAQRRRFWERFADLGFVGEASDFNATTLIANARNAQPGRVTFVGAGPGDAEHLTLKAVRALQGADVILFDELVSDEVLELARREARRILVRPRRDETGTMVTSLVKQGRHVVRLTSGDPVVSGIADGEAAGLRARNIPVTIVRGVSRLPDVAHAQRQYSSM